MVSSYMAVSPPTGVPTSAACTTSAVDVVVVVAAGGVDVGVSLFADSLATSLFFTTSEARTVSLKT